jgi:hypothetical protein
MAQLGIMATTFERPTLEAILDATVLLSRFRYGET